MISITQWRATIGCFSPQHKQKCRASHSGMFKNISLAGISVSLRLCIALSLVILACGDVEQHPGPDLNEIMKELKEMRRSMDSQFDSLKQDINNIKADLLLTNESVRKVKADLDGVYDELYMDLAKTKSRLASLESKMEKQERYSRRDNLILYDVSEEKNESQTTTTDKVKNLLNQHVSGKNWSDSDFTRLHRLKTRSSGNQPIIIRLARSADKFKILNSRSILKQKGIGVGNDLTLAQREELKSLRAEGKRGYFKNGRLLVDPPGTSSQDHREQDRVDRSQQSSSRGGGRGRGDHRR